MTLLLYGNPESGHTYKVKLFLDVAGFDYHYELVDIFISRQDRPEPFRSLSLSKFGEVPLLIHQERVYAQSNAILLYLAELSGSYGAQSASLFNSVKEWLFWEANKLGLSLPHLRLARNYFPEEFPPGAVEWLQRRFTEDVSRFEKELSDGRMFICGDELTVADFSLCGYLFFANQAAVEVPQFVRKWMVRLQQLPKWRPPFELLSPDTDYVTFGVVKDQYNPKSCPDERGS